MHLKSPKKRWHCILSAESTKTHFFRLFFGDFAHWDASALKKIISHTNISNRVINLAKSIIFEIISIIKAAADTALFILDLKGYLK